MSRKGKREERRACLVLLTAAAAFFAVQQLGGWLLNARWPEVRFPGLDERLRHAQAAEPNAALFFGSSRFGCGIKPERIAQEWAERGLQTAKPVNLAVPAGDFVAMEAVLSYLRRHVALRPPLVVLEASPETLGQKTYWLSFHASRQYGWAELPAMLDEDLGSSSVRRFLIANVFPVWKHRAAIRHELLRQMIGLPERDAGLTVLAEPELREMRQRVNAMSLEQKMEDGVAPMRRWFGKNPYRVGGANAAKLDRMLQAFQKAGSTVALVGVPVCRKQRALYTPEVEAQFQAAVAERLRRFPNVRWLDARALVADQDFNDNHHLTGKGAAQFSAWLAERLEPEVRKAAAGAQGRSLAIK